MMLIIFWHFPELIEYPQRHPKTSSLKQCEECWNEKQKEVKMPKTLTSASKAALLENAGNPFATNFINLH